MMNITAMAGAAMNTDRRTARAGARVSPARMAMYLVKPGLENEDKLVVTACRELHDRFEIEHAALQIARDQRAATCAQAPADVA